MASSNTAVYVFDFTPSHPLVILLLVAEGLLTHVIICIRFGNVLFGEHLQEPNILNISFNWLPNLHDLLIWDLCKRNALPLK